MLLPAGKYDTVPSRVLLYKRNHGKVPLGCCYMQDNLTECHFSVLLFTRNHEKESFRLPPQEIKSEAFIVGENFDDMPSRVPLV